MAAATVNIPAIALSVGPMLNGWYKGERTGSGTIKWKAAKMLAAGKIDAAGIHRARRLLGAFARLLQHDGHRDHHELPGRGAGHDRCPAAPPFPRPTRERGEIAYRTGKRIVEMVCGGSAAVGHHDPRAPSRTRSSSTRPSAARPTRRSISTRSRATSGSSSPTTIGRRSGYEIPLLVDLQPAGEYPRRGLPSRWRRAGGGRPS